MKVTSLVTIALLVSFYSFSQKNELTLWYQQPARDWNEALPVGNGRLGAMVFGGTESERIQLNEESLWAGQQMDDNNPQSGNHLKEIQQLILNDQPQKAHQLADKYMLATPPRLRSHQTLGDLFIDFGQQGAIKNYTRSLDLNTGIANTDYEIDGVKYKREVFASAPGNVIIIHISASKPASLSCKITLNREKDATVQSTADGTLQLSGQIVDVTDQSHGKGGLGMKFHALAKTFHDGGNITTVNNSVLVEDATTITLVFTAATDYNFSKLNFDRAMDSRVACEKIISNLPSTDLLSLKQIHLSEYQPLFSRMSIQLGTADKSSVPTDKRLEEVKNGNTDEQLTALYFQYARYLLLSSSRKPGVLPANLQGIWNKDFNAPWDADFHTNINIQMNYWLAEMCNIPETVEPLTNFIDYMRVPGRVSAQEMYNAKGWMMHHCTDAFGRTGIHGGVNWGASPLAGSWLCLHLWQHYEFTKDNAYLRDKAYPIMKESAEFIQSFLIEDKNGYLVTAPSMSPENAFKLPDGSNEQLTYAPTIDVAIIQSLYRACIESAKILNIDKPFIASLEQTLKRLPPIKVSKKFGTIQEWINDYDEAEPGHRHISHLFALHPGSIITPQTPELFEAASKTLERRLANGGGHTGWSRAWIVNFYARLLNAEKAYDNLVALLAKSTQINLFDTHPPFQIDGNFGGAAGIGEMLLQSQNGMITLLPALPAAWKDGSIKGICARGNFVIDMEWKDGEITTCKILSRAGGVANVFYKNNRASIKTKAGVLYELGKDFKWKK